MTSTDSTADTPDLATKTAGATPQRRAFGVDVGGSGI